MANRNKEPREVYYYQATQRFGEKLITRMRKMAKQNERDLNSQMELLLRNQMGFCPISLCIVQGDTYYWVSPLGTWGELTESSFSRFCRGISPISRNRWDDEYDSEDEFVQTIGEVIADKDTLGIRIRDYEKFKELQRLYEHKG